MKRAGMSVFGPRRLYITTDFSTVRSNIMEIEFTFVHNKSQISGLCSLLHDFLAVIVLENVGEFVDRVLSYYRRQM
jgi:hypothetical protein